MGMKGQRSASAERAVSADFSVEKLWEEESLYYREENIKNEDFTTRKFSQL